MKIEFDSVESVIEDIRQGRMVIVTDDENRENEGDLRCAAELVTPEMINFMITPAMSAPSEEHANMFGASKGRHLPRM